MTYYEFVTIYHTPSKVTDEQAHEGLHYTRNIFLNLEDRTKVVIGMSLVAAKHLSQAVGNSTDHSDCFWKKIVLSILSEAIVSQGLRTHTPYPFDIIDRSDKDWLLCAHVVDLDVPADDDKKVNTIMLN